MSYEEALSAAGAEVLEFRNFGSYQGDWWAKVTLNGETFWAHGSYGSCSGCDAFEAEFDYKSEECGEHRYDASHPPCAGCDAAKADYAVRLAEFGAGYLDDRLTQEQAETEASRNLEWDMDAKEMIAFIKENPL